LESEDGGFCLEDVGPPLLLKIKKEKHWRSNIPVKKPTTVTEILASERSQKEILRKYFKGGQLMSS
jgi:hypothetical protein